MMIAASVSCVLSIAYTQSRGKYKNLFHMIVQNQEEAKKEVREL